MLLIFSVMFAAPNMPPLQAKRTKSMCSKLSQSKCQANRSCVYVKSYKTKKGTVVKSHCRTKAKRINKKRRINKKKTSQKRAYDKKKDVKKKKYIKNKKNLKKKAN